MKRKPPFMSSNQETSRVNADTVCRKIRREIVSGTLAPGSQLATWDVMESQFGVGRATLMRALGRLKRDGFVFASSTRGTFVDHNPPHLSRYGLAFQSAPGAPGWNRFWRSLHFVATEMNAGGERRIPMFFNINGHSDQSESQRLLEEVESDCLAGVIFVGPIEWMSAKLLSDPSIPKVAIATDSPTADYPHVYVDHASFVNRSVNYLASRGRKKIAVLKTHADHFDGFPAAIAERGLQTRPWWQLPFDPVQPNAAFAATRLLLDQANTDRPDGLVVCDDNMVESAMAAVVDSGMRVPHDLEIVTHCNWQSPVSTVLATQRLGFDVKAILDAAMEVVDVQRKGGVPRLWTAIPARFEEEKERRS